MSQLTDSQLTELSNTVQNETVAGANTATRIGELFNDLTDSKINNDKISTDMSVDSGSNSKVPSVAAVETQLATKQNSLGFTAENVANKSTNTSLGTSNTLYPSQNAVKSYVDSSISAYVPPTPTLQQVTTAGNITSQNLITRAAQGAIVGVQNQSAATKAYLSYFSNNGWVGILNASANELNIKATNLTANRDLEAPDKSGTIATTDDLVFYRSVVSLTSSDIANMDSVQVIAVPAPPSGKAICVTSIAVKTNSGTGWTTSNNILLRPVGGSTGVCSTQGGPLSTANGVFSENVTMNWFTPTPSNAALEFRGSQGVPPSGGTLGATVYITYQLVNI